MSLPPINPFAGLAAVGADDRRTQQQEREQNRTQEKIQDRATGDAESAAMEAATDRDADGRQNWQRPSTARRDPDSDSTPTDPEPNAERPHNRDPYHVRGNHLDLDG